MGQAPGVVGPAAGQRREGLHVPPAPALGQRTSHYRRRRAREARLHEAMGTSRGTTGSHRRTAACAASACPCPSPRRRPRRKTRPREPCRCRTISSARQSSFPEWMVPQAPRSRRSQRSARRFRPSSCIYLRGSTATSASTRRRALQGTRTPPAVHSHARLCEGYRATLPVLGQVVQQLSQGCEHSGPQPQ